MSAAEENLHSQAYVAMVPDQLGVDVSRGIEAASRVLQMSQLQNLDKLQRRCARARSETEREQQRRERYLVRGTAPVNHKVQHILLRRVLVALSQRSMKKAPSPAGLQSVRRPNPTQTWTLAGAGLKKQRASSWA
jgi:DNA-binding protein H-NS